METISGVIQKKDQSSGVDRFQKPYVRWVFQINDKKYSTFDENIGKKFNVGESVQMEGEKKGDYWNMVNMINVPLASDNKPYNPNGAEDLLRQILAELKGIGKNIENGKSPEQKN